MKRFAALAGVLVVGLVAPATVGAAAKTYVGVFESSGELGFKVKKTEHGKKIKEFDWFQFPLQCQSGPRTTTNGLSFAPKVRDRRFEAVAIVGNQGNPKAELRLTGKLKSGGSAEGTLKIEGRDVPLDPEPTSDKCSSPKTSWTASVVNRAARSSAPTHSPWVTPR
jgi:ABC-type sugar transport system substrate-binding protein